MLAAEFPDGHDSKEAMSTPVSGQIMIQKAAIVTPPKTPPRKADKGEVVVERMELSAKGAERLSGKINDLMVRLSTAFIHAISGARLILHSILGSIGM